MEDPETDQRDVNEAEEVFLRLVVAGRDTPGVFEPVEAEFDQITEAIQRAIDTNPGRVSEVVEIGRRRNLRVN